MGEGNVQSGSTKNKREKKHHHVHMHINTHRDTHTLDGMLGKDLIAQAD